MDDSTFIGQVQNRAERPSQEDAVRVTRVTLETLSRRIDPNEADDLAARLPEEIGRYLAKVDELFALAEQETLPVDEEQRPQ